ncbi:translation termination factor GTPase eRF3 [Malassezia japonica]|uniref:Eukaryotic peptide chain release factor GTP-binding subunit n=1 Tax=Malassezia japonica TaxID=223818 RepID=A0AAF0F4X2_9BASI|nr:translation termination factor GTPase eRF3 [Malassezia japonica]WFD39934.1 translation termination factor GTPase eRF3 [Malassezia japonica]
MNPNAPSFGFNPAASGFVPRTFAQPQQQQGNDAYYNQGFGNQGFTGQGNVGEDFAQDYTSQGFGAQGFNGGLQGQDYTSQGFGGAGLAAPGAGAPKQASTTGTAPLPPMAAAMAADKPAGAKKAVSISLGGAKKEPAPPKAEPKAEKPAEKAAEKPAEKAADKAAEKPAEKSAEKPATKGQAVKQQVKVEKKVADKAAVDADKVMDDARKATDEDTLKDLFGETEIKSHMNVVFVGHVDAGKSTMGGNLLYLTGMVDKRTLEKYEREAKELGRESWYLSWALDSTSQERAKGKTVEVGRAYFETEKRRYTLLDAPGHKSYVPNMIGGAAQADIAILVISARRGEFETGFERGGQTREHAMLVKTAGVQRLVVVVNKMDDPTVNWDKERYDEIIGKLLPFLKSAGFNPKTDLTFIPVSAYSGANLKEHVSKEVCPWDDGPALIPFLDSMDLGDRKLNESLKLPVSEKYADMGTYIVGKLESGKVKKGDNLVLMPNRTQVEVAGIFSEVDEEVPAAISGDNVRIKLKGADMDEVQAGFVLTDAKDPVHVVTRFEAQLAILEHRNIMCAGYSAVMHAHALSEEVNLIELLHYYDKKTGKKSRRGPQFAKKGMKIIALVQTAQPVCLERFKDYPQLGRFTLRDEGKTVAIGKVTKLLEDTPDLEKLNLKD